MTPSPHTRLSTTTPHAQPRRAWLAASLNALLATAALAVALPAAAQGSAAQPLVRLKTSQGDIVLRLDPAKAPVTVDNFLQYVKAGHYDGTVFHRVIDGFMIQGGGYNADLRERPTRAPIKLEAGNGLRNTRGAIAMARTGNPNSATAQFFINVADNPNLDAPRPDGYGYAVFGQVPQGMDVVDKIRAVRTGNRGPFQNVPIEPVTITQAIIKR
ncbi:MAG: Peptidyl-prolyl cis-trans isomerase A [Paracidovorax wautersii]|uniref:Peptidyl-prolyl cis-trans isomerase n=1 Tax=Paracidovorax wautersii TaxID=1177982 RepID=A0A7V8FKR9_9BURK|nr:MAG: Peptidyl-prolyl cis-trans isomerase A [Paracidovorax wautersii]